MPEVCLGYRATSPHLKKINKIEKMAAQWIKYLQDKCRAQVQLSEICIKLCVAAQVCNPSMLASLVCLANKVEGESPYLRLSSDLHILCGMHVPILIPKYTYMHSRKGHTDTLKILKYAF